MSEDYNSSHSSVRTVGGLVLVQIGCLLKRERATPINREARILDFVLSRCQEITF